MSYYVTNENSVLNINNAHLKVSGNIQTDVMKLGAIEFAPPASDVPGTVNFTNVTTGVTTSSNLNVGGTLMLGSVELVTATAALEQTVNLGNVTSNTVQFTNPTTSLVASGNVVVTGNVTADHFVGDGSELTALNAANITSGTLDAARIPTLNQSTTGSAGSAATLTNSRTIGGVNFNGSADITPTTFNAISTGAITSSGDIKGGCPVYFSARMTGNIAASHAGNRIAWNTLDDSRGGGFSTSSGTFTAPIAGRYKFSYFLRGNVNDSFKIKPRINGSPSFNTTNDGTNQNLLGSAFVYNDGRAGSAVFITYLNAGGTVDLHACTHGNSHSNGLATYYNGFTGEYLSSL